MSSRLRRPHVKIEVGEKARNTPQSPAEFLVVHCGLVFALAPFLGHQLRLVELELALFSHPGDAVSGILVGQQFQQKLPQLDLTIVAWHKDIG